MGEAFNKMMYDSVSGLESEIFLRDMIIQQRIAERNPLSLAAVQFDKKFYSERIKDIKDAFEEDLNHEKEIIDFSASNSDICVVFIGLYNSKGSYEEAVKNTDELVRLTKTYIKHILGVEVKINNYTHNPDEITEQQRQNPDWRKQKTDMIIDYLSKFD